MPVIRSERLPYIKEVLTSWFNLDNAGLFAGLADE